MSKHLQICPDCGIVQSDTEKRSGDPCPNPECDTDKKLESVTRSNLGKRHKEITGEHTYLKDDDDA